VAAGRVTGEARAAGVAVEDEAARTIGRPIPGTPAGVEGLAGAAVGLAAGLSQVSKKSSVEAAGVFEARGVSSNPSMWIPCGFLPLAEVSTRSA